MALTTAEERTSILGLLDKLAKLSEYNDGLLVFEHGGCDPLDSCMDHAHFHAISAKEKLSCEHIGACEAAVFAKQGQELPPQGKYLFLAQLRNGQLSGCVATDECIGKQHFRRKIANLMDQKEFDWRLGMNKDYMQRLVASARNELR